MCSSIDSPQYYLNIQITLVIWLHLNQCFKRCGANPSVPNVLNDVVQIHLFQLPQAWRVSFKEWSMGLLSGPFLLVNKQLQNIFT